VTIDRLFTPTADRLLVRLQVNSNVAGRSASFSGLSVALQGRQAAVVAPAAAHVVDPAPMVSPQFQQDGPYWPQIVDISEIAPIGIPPLMLICSTDHCDALSAKAGLYFWRSASTTGPWTFGGQFYISQPTTWPAPTGPNLPYAQMEAPTARVLTDPADGRKKLFIHAHYFAYVAPR
jgi:hypothetical protein